MMKIKYIGIITFPFLLTFLPQVQAVEGLTANAGFTSKQLWRDLEQTNGDAGVSGGIDYASESGFYIGTWTSNANWSDGMTYELNYLTGHPLELLNHQHLTMFKKQTKHS